MKATITLAEMKNGEHGIIIDVSGGMGATQRIRNMGVIVGRKITKMSSHFMKGPQTVRVGNTKIALGYNMASKILIEVDRNDS
ncbi:ferrous iron transport protein A [Candidatus Omnitrophota bacterium]